MICWTVEPLSGPYTLRANFQRRLLHQAVTLPVIPNRKNVFIEHLVNGLFFDLCSYISLVVHKLSGRRIRKPPCVCPMFMTIDNSFLTDPARHYQCLRSSRYSLRLESYRCPPATRCIQWRCTFCRGQSAAHDQILHKLPQDTVTHLSGNLA